MSRDDDRVEPYDHGVQTRQKLQIAGTYEYRFPFNYENIEVDRSYYTGEGHGLELQPVPETMGGDPADRIVINEEQPVVRVAAIGSACTPAGWIALEADPLEGERHEREPEVNLPVRFRKTGLWGYHLRGDSHIPEGMDNHYSQFPNTGMSCAVFEIPRSKTVEIFGGSQVPGWSDDNVPDDLHYSFRTVRTTVVEE